MPLLIDIFASLAALITGIFVREYFLLPVERKLTYHL